MVSSSFFTILVDGKLLNTFKSIRVESDFLNASTVADITIPGKPFGDKPPIRLGQLVKLYFKDHILINGFVDMINPTMSMDGRNIVIKIRDRAGDLVDSTINPADFKPITAPIRLEQLLKQYIDSLGIKDMSVINNTDIDFFIEPFTPKDNIAAQPGENYFDHMMKYAHKRGVIIRADSDGNLAIEQGPSNKYKTKLGRSVVESSSYALDLTKRYYRYVIFGQSSNAVSFDQETSDNPTNIQAEVFDRGEDIGGTRKTRTYAFLSETPLDKASAEQRVKWEANYRRSNSIKYSCVLPGMQPISDGSDIWQVNRLVDVQDDTYGLQQTMMIGKVVFDVPNMGKSTSTLNLLTKDAFTLTVNKPAKEAKLAQTGGDFTMTEAEANEQNKKIYGGTNWK